MVTSAIVMVAATAIVRRNDRYLLADKNGESILLTKSWAKPLLHRLGYVKRRGSSTAKEMEEILSALVLNWDHTGISIVPGSL